MADRDPGSALSASDVLDGLAGAVLVVAGEALVLRYLNTAAEDLVRLSRRRALGQPLDAVAGLDPDWLERVRAHLASGTPFTAREVSVATHDATSVRLADASVTPIADASGEDRLLVELTPVDRHLRIAREEGLRSQEATNRRLLRGLAHEIRNPLAGLRGAAQLLASEVDDRALGEYTTMIVREADRLRALVDRMVGPVDPPRFEPVNVHRLTEHLAQLLRAEAGDGIAVHTDYDPSIPEMRADGDQLVQALLNLGRNALQALGEQGTITIRTATRRRFTIGTVQHRLVACIEIADDGPGVPRELQESLFQPMVSDRAEGSGLGLTVAQSLVGRHDGLIECDSEPGSTVFRILLPLEVGDD